MLINFDNYEIDIAVKCRYEDQPNAHALDSFISEITAAFIDAAFYHNDVAARKNAEGDLKQAAAEKAYVAFLDKRFDELYAAHKAIIAEECDGDCDSCVHRKIVEDTAERIDREPAYYCDLFVK